MKFIIAVNDEKHEAFLTRAKAVFGDNETFTRVGYTPETCPEATPKWWLAGDNRWALLQGIIFALETAQQAGEDCEIFEDDCIFKPDYAERRATFLENLPSDWDMVYFGGQLLARQFYPLREIEGNEHVLLAKNVHRNHNWICRNATIPRLVEWLRAECWSNRHTTDWRIGYLQMEPYFRTYIPKLGWISGQGAGMSQLDQVEYPDRRWHFTEPEITEERKTWETFCTAQKQAEERKRFENWKASIEERSE